MNGKYAEATNTPNVLVTDIITYIANNPNVPNVKISLNLSFVVFAILIRPLATQAYKTETNNPIKMPNLANIPVNTKSVEDSGNIDNHLKDSGVFPIKVLFLMASIDIPTWEYCGA